MNYIIFDEVFTEDPYPEPMKCACGNELLTEDEERAEACDYCQ